MTELQVDLTAAACINRLGAQMRPFDRQTLHGHPLHAMLVIDVSINHVDLAFRATPLERRAFMDHEEGLILIGMPRGIGGFHARDVILGDRGAAILSTIASLADARSEGVCVSSPDVFTAAIAEMVACLDDAETQEAVHIPADELLLKELRLKALSPAGKNINRFEQLVSHDGPQLMDADLGIKIDCEETLQLAISHRVKKACAMGVNIQNLEGRLRDIYEFCTEGVKLDIDREVGRAMPGAVPYRTFTEALGYVCASFEPQIEEAAEDGIMIDDAHIEMDGVTAPERFVDHTQDLFDAEPGFAVLGRVTKQVMLGRHRIVRVVKGAIEAARDLTLEDLISLSGRAQILARRMQAFGSRILPSVTRSRSSKISVAGSVLPKIRSWKVPTSDRAPYESAQFHGRYGKGPALTPG